MRLAAAFLTFLAWTSFGGATVPQNVLLIAIDDLGTNLGCYGNLVAKTPCIDRLSSKGICFERAYAQVPLCNPSRAALLTGLRPDQIRVYDQARRFREEKPEVVTLPQRFRQEGYFAARIGSVFSTEPLHGAPDDSASWDRTLNPKGRDRAEEHLVTAVQTGIPLQEGLAWLAAEGTDEEQTDGLVATETIRLLESNQEEHFFIAAGFSRPRSPFVAPKKYFQLYPLDELRLPFAPENDRQDIPEAAFPPHSPVPKDGLAEPLLRQAMQAYYASTSFVDAQVGRILDALERLDLVEKTIVVLWSDHGFHLGDHHGIWQMRTLFEQGTRSALIFRIPWLAANGSSCRRVVELLDIYPTLLELTGIASAGELGGRSLLPLLHNPLAEWDGYAVSQVLRPARNPQSGPVMGCSIRTERWRYTEWAQGASGRELYDHHSDPQEFHNLASQPGPDVQTTIEQLQLLLRTRASGEAPASSFNPKHL